MNPTKRLTIGKKFVFEGNRASLDEILRTSDLNYSTVTESEVVFYPTVSFGTLTAGGLGSRISVTALLTPFGEDRTSIHLRTDVRPEHYLIVVTFMIILVTTSLADDPGTTSPCIFATWPVCHVWFQFIYRLQENHLVENIKSKLRLSEKKISVP